MRKLYVGILLSVVLMPGMTGVVQASGFNIYEAGARATALGGAFTATADDGSALFYNAAGLSFIEGNTASLNIMPVGPRFKFAEDARQGGDAATGEVEHKYYLIPGAYYTRHYNETIAWGVGVYAPFGLGVEWMDPDAWIGRQVNYDVGIETVYVTPAISMKFSEKVAVAIGMDIATQHLSLQKYTLHPTLGVNAIDTHIEGRAAPNFTFSLGAMYKPTNKLSFGFMWHQKKTMSYTDKEVTLANAIAPGSPGHEWSSNLLAGLGGSKQNLSAAFKLPYFMSLGVAYQLHERVRAEFNYVYFGWEHFDKLTMNFANDALDQTIDFNYENTGQFRFGVDFIAIPDRLNVMAGFVHDKTPQPLESVSPLLPDSDRNDYSFGLQYKTGNWDFTGSYMGVVGEARTTVNDDGTPANHDPAYPSGTYKSVANIYAFGVGYHF